jgi:hypothetical protein
LISGVATRTGNLSRTAKAAVILLAFVPATFPQTREHPQFTPEVKRFVENFKPDGQDHSHEVSSLSPTASGPKTEMITPHRGSNN